MFAFDVVSHPEGEQILSTCDVCLSCHKHRDEESNATEDRRLENLCNPFTIVCWIIDQPRFYINTEV